MGGLLNLNLKIETPNGLKVELKDANLESINKVMESVITHIDSSHDYSKEEIKHEKVISFNR